jgi:putative transposase
VDRLAPGKKNATRLGAHLVHVDESGFLLIPSVHKTWAPCGQTPIIRHRYQRDKISVISGISVSPVRQRLGLYWQALRQKNFKHPQVLDFLRHLLRHLRGQVIVLWDRGRIHKGDPIHDFCRRFPRLHLEYFPGYAPELNPDEGVWRLVKKRLANGRPDDLDELLAHLTASLSRIARSPALLRACILKSDLPFF